MATDYRLHLYLKKWLPRIWGIFMLLMFSLAVNATAVQAQQDCTQCHKNESKQVQASEHRSLSCTNCHSNITGFPHSEGASLDKKESVETCTKCHKGSIAESYEESFHAKAVHLGSQKAASCADCHGAHNILGQDNPASQVAKENVPTTCARCHGQESAGFAQGNEHFQLAAMGPGVPMFYTARFFVWLTMIVLTALVIHIELQLFQNLRIILRERKEVNSREK